MKCSATTGETITFDDYKMSSLYRFILVCCFFLFLQKGFCQLASTFSFTHYGMLNGLASNEINSVVQDRTGYLWIATNNGLQRFDGVQFKTFRRQEGNTSSLPSNILEKVFIDRDDNLWVIGAYTYVGIFDKNSFTYKPVAVKPRNPNYQGSERKLIEDEYGNLFLLMRGKELLQYNKELNEFSYKGHIIPVKPEWGIASLSQQPGTSKYWLGIQGGGIAIYNKKSGNLSYWGHNVEHEPAIEILGPKLGFAHSIFDKKGRLWFETWDDAGFPYIMQYDPGRKKNPLQRFELLSTLKSYYEVHGFMEQRDGRIWVRGAQVFGYFNEEDNEFELIPNSYQHEQGIQYQLVTNLYEDREKNVWVTTRNNGIYRFNPSLQYFINVPHLHPVSGKPGEGSVMTFMETRNGDLLTGCWGDGLFRYNRQLKSIPLQMKNWPTNMFPSIWGMHASADSNTIWMACQPGLCRYDQANRTITFYNPPVFENRTMRQVVEDRKGNLWMGMHGAGVFRWKNPKLGKADSIIKVTEAGNCMVNKMICDSRGLVWVATGADGLFVFDGNTGKLWQHFDGKSSDKKGMIGTGVSAVLEYNDTLVLISNIDNLFFYNRNRDSLYNLILPEALMGAITSLERDDLGFVWISTTNALYRYHPFFRTLVMFNRLDGIHNDRFVLSASYRMKDGRLLFGTDNSFIVFNPASIRLAEKHIPIVFTSIQIGKNELRIDSVTQLDRLTLGPNDNSITIEFSSLTYAESPIIQYKLDGIDDEWHTADRTNRATFPFLPPGKYTLRLRTVNANGVPSPNQTILSIYIRAPFWQTWWFYSLLAIGLALLLYWYDRQRTKRKEALQKVRTDIASGLHEEVNTALNNINILSEIARLKSDKEPHRAKEYLEQIHAKSHHMIIALDDMLWSLDPQNDSMDKTIQRIKEFADALMQRHGVLIELLIDKKVERLELDMKWRHEAFLLFKEGLRSLVTAGTKLCIVHLTPERGKLLFTIEFENEGCDMQQLNNLLHRRDMEARLQALKAKLNVQVHKSRSVFLLQLPIN